MPEIAYTVACRFAQKEVAEQWCRWLLDHHLADVVDAGASRAQLVRIDPENIDPEEDAEVRCEARYVFPSREAFTLYERDEAPRLRREGLEKFPLDLGLTYERSVGEIVGDEES